jgi:hypothetical protein
MIKDFEEYLSFIENQLEVKLFDWQKVILYKLYNGEYPIVKGIRSGKFALYQAAQMLKEEIEKEK